MHLLKAHNKKICGCHRFYFTPFLEQSSRRSLSDFALKETKKVNVDFNLRQLTDVDREAEYLGINRQACIKVLLDESLVRRKSQRMALSNS